MDHELSGEINENIANIARESIRRVLLEDRALLDSHAHECSVAFRVGHYMACEVARQRLMLSVDAEYNRDGPGRNPKKTDRLVRPDLIVHQRGCNTYNLLAVEAKIWSTAANRRHDIKKLRDYRRMFEYPLTLFLDFRRLGEAHLVWIGDDSSMDQEEWILARP